MSNMNKLCIVLKPPESIVKEFIGRSKDEPEKRLILQPNAEDIRLSGIKKLGEKHLLPVAIYLLIGETATAVGQLLAIEYREDLSREDKKVAKTRISKNDTGLSRNLLFVSKIHRLQKQLPLSSFRKLDGQPLSKGRWVYARCKLPRPQPVTHITPDILFNDTDSAIEGKLRLQMIRHRSREVWLRKKKISKVLKTTGRLSCEVRGCNFDFDEVYRDLGKGYALVHHLRPLSSRERPTETKLGDLAIVCPNCHAMIHRGGKCRSLSKVAATLSN